MSKWFPSLLALLLVVCGCSFGQLPDPNDPRDVGVLDPDVLRRKLKWASDNLNERVARGEIDDAKSREMISAYADELVSMVPIDKIEVARAWEYGEVFRTARRWQLAKAAYLIAVEQAKGEDRRVNDTLRLAHVMASMGDVEEAIATAEKVMDAKPLDTAPILPAVLLEIVPAAEGKGKDAELSALLEKAIEKHRTTIVDPKLDAGKAFLGARPFHIRNAWGKVVELYRAAGRDAEADAARERMNRMMAGMAQL